MAERAQTYKNHVRWLPPFHFFAAPVMFANFINGARHVWLTPSRSTAFALLVAAALLVVTFLTRIEALLAQDRVIRLEMRLRLAGVLPDDLQRRCVDLTPKQLVALRFASDAEMPALVRDVLEGKVSSPKDIKLRIKDWQPDWLRV